MNDQLTARVRPRANCATESAYLDHQEVAVFFRGGNEYLSLDVKKAHV